MAQSVVFNVTRGTPELITPARPTPYEFKQLSDIDDQESFRFQIPVIHFYRNENNHNGGSLSLDRDPAKVIKEAIGKALVFYYPFAGRLREKEGRKLVVECNGEGVMFVEAIGDVTLKELEGVTLKPPFALDKLLFDVPGSVGVLDTPLLHIQVTRLKCGGFILAQRFNHTMVDAPGFYMLMNAVAEIARGAESPSVQPVWMRHVLSARNPPQLTYEHPEYHLDETFVPFDDLVHKSFFFGPKEIASLKRLISPYKNPTTFEIITACIWRCRTIALQLDPQDTVRFICLFNARYLFDPFIPSGYYGNAFALPESTTTAGKLSTNPIGYALDLVRRAKCIVTRDYMHSVADYLVLKGRPPFNPVRTFLVSDVTKGGFEYLDFGWGLPVFAGPAEDGIGPVPGVVSFYTPLKNGEGEKGVLVPLRLPRNVMDVFVKELYTLVGHDLEYGSSSSTSRSKCTSKL